MAHDPMIFPYLILLLAFRNYMNSKRSTTIMFALRIFLRTLAYVEVRAINNKDELFFAAAGILHPKLKYPVVHMFSYETVC